MVRIGSDNTHCGLLFCIISKYRFGITPCSLFHVLPQMDAKYLKLHDAASGSLLVCTSLASAPSRALGEAYFTFHNKWKIHLGQNWVGTAERDHVTPQELLRVWFLHLRPYKLWAVMGWSLESIIGTTELAGAEQNEKLGCRSWLHQKI